MTDKNENAQRDPVPPFIRRQLESFPVFPGEDRQELKSTFLNLAFQAGEAPETASDFLLVYRASVLVYGIQHRERMRLKISRHHHLPAVTSLTARVHKPGAEKDSIAEINRREMAREYFASDQGKKKLTELFVRAGYESDAVETEAFLQSQSYLVGLDREIANLNKQLLANFKELDRRYTRRAAEAIREEAKAIIARARSDKKAT